MLSLNSVPPQLILKCTPEKFSELIEREGIRPAPYVGRYKWAMLERLDALPADDLQDLVRQSYVMVSAKKRSKRQEPSGKKKRNGSRN